MPGPINGIDSRLDNSPLRSLICTDCSAYMTTRPLFTIGRRCAHSDSSTHAVRGFSLIALGYILVTYITDSQFIGDTVYYARDIQMYLNGGDSGALWEFGHLLWRPTGLLLFRVCHNGLSYTVGDNVGAQIVASLAAINWVCGLISLLLFFDVLLKVVRYQWIAFLAASSLMMTNVFVTYIHSGTSYFPGLMCLLAGVRVLILETTPPAHEGSRVWMLAAIPLTLSVLFWFPYIFVLPAALAAPQLLNRRHNERWRQSCLVGCMCLGLGVLSYGIALWGLGIRSLGELEQWVVNSGHGLSHSRSLGAIGRLAFSLPRSFINMGRDNVVFKQYLVHDPYVSVSLLTLASLGWWKVLLFYLGAGLSAAQLVRSRRGRAIGYLLAIASFPVFFFAAFIFEPSSIERYLPIAPFLLLALAEILAGDIARFTLKTFIVSLVLMSAVVNIWAMNRVHNDAERRYVAARIETLRPFLRPASLVMTVSPDEDVARFYDSYPLDATARLNGFRVYNVLIIGNRRVEAWRQEFATKTLSVWKQSGDVWLSTHLLRSRPKPEWFWVEGDDPRIRWTDLSKLFVQLDVGETIGGEDGFVLLRRSPANEQVLDTLLKGSTEYSQCFNPSSGFCGAQHRKPEHGDTTTSS